MELDTDIGSVLGRYSLDPQSCGVTKLEATHRAFRIDADDRSYALRQFNRFMTAADLTAQARLAIALSESGLSTPAPLAASDGRLFAQVDRRLWALFPWCGGHPGDSREFSDLAALVSAQGEWVKCAGQLDRSPHWNAILAAAKRFRRRKDWAWVVPLDRLPRFVDEIALPALSSTGGLEGEAADRLRGLLPRLSDAASRLEQVLDGHSVADLPRLVTHGDFWASNICISEGETCVLDLDCFSHEPRVADFARSAHWYYTSCTPEQNRFLMARFHAAAGLAPEEVRALPALILAHEFYYLIGAALRFPGESAHAQLEIVADISSGLDRLRAWHRERAVIEESFLVDRIGEASRGRDPGHAVSPMHAEISQHRKGTNSVFGVSREQIQDVVAAVAGEPVVSVRLRVEQHVQGHRGYSAEKVIPTFAYTTASGRSGEATVFCKRFHAAGRREGFHYMRLQHHGAPVARMYGSLCDADDREIVFLEFLDPVGELHPFDRFVVDAALFLPFLVAAARFNAVQVSDHYAAELAPATLPGEDLSEVHSTLDRIWRYAVEGELGDRMRLFCSRRSAELVAIQDLAGELIEPVKRIPLGLTHNDFCPDNTGWRHGTKELLIVDLESVGLGPRFVDVARWIGSPDDIRARCRPQRELARHYLDEYLRCGGPVVSLERFLEEVRILWLARTLTMLFFRLGRALDGRVDWTDDRDEGRRVYRDDLHRELVALLHCAGGER